ncbi:retrovirus-related pol polyprotein from transposon TNT 1-94 [Tanacetum coccineum]
MNEDKIKKDLEEIETINIEMDHRVSKIIAENEHLKQTYKQFYDSIKPTRIQSKEQCDDLINQVNLKSVEISDLNASLQEKVLVITALKDDLRKLKGKALVDNAVTKHTIDPEMLKIDKEAAVLRDLVEHVKANYPLDHSLESAFRYTKLIQELLTNISKTCPSINNSGEKLVAVTPKNKDKRVRFTEPITSSGNTNTKTSSSSNLVSNKPMLSSTGIKPSTSASGSQPSGNTKKDKIQQTPSSTLKNKVEAHPRKVKSSLKNKNSVVEPKGTATVQHSKLNANSKIKCVKCNGCMLSDNHDLYVLDFINNVNARVKSKSIKKSSKRKVWKPTRKVFTNIGYIWRPTSRTFTKVGNACPLTRITAATEMPLRKPTDLENETPKPVITLVYSRKPRKSKNNVHVSKSKIGNVMISRVYYVEGLGHNFFFIRKFCDSNLKVAFRQHTCFIRNLEARHGLVWGLPKLKFEKDHLCSACAMGKSKKKPHKPKSEDTNQEKLYLLHMDLCGPIRVASVNRKKYILVIVDDYSRFTWVKCLRSKDEAPDFIIKFLKMIQVRLKVPIRRIRTDNGTEFVNQTLREYYEKVVISHETSVAHFPQQNSVVERRNRTLIKAACTMLIYAKAPLFLWAEAVATTCYTQNCFIIRLHHDKTPYELLHDKPPDLLFFHVFGALCYPTNDNFDELTSMASEHSKLGPALQEMTPAIISSGLVPNPPPSPPFVPPSRTDWDLLFQPLFDELLNPPSSVDCPAPEVITSITEVVAPEPAASTGSPSSTTVDQDAPSPSNSQTTPETQSPIIPNDVEEDNHDLDVAHMNNDPLFGIPILENNSEASSSSDAIPTVVHTATPNSEHVTK